MRARAYCAHLSIGHYWALRCMSRYLDQVRGQICCQIDLARSYCHITDLGSGSGRGLVCSMTKIRTDSVAERLGYHCSPAITVGVGYKLEVAWNYLPVSVIQAQFD
ncbi:hypothetical protein TNCV_1722261 [Trichonephila clavipes]|nr:hypothetical protein TNCV_1722261 [Trichonephila clavipes]